MNHKSLSRLSALLLVLSVPAAAQPTCVVSASENEGKMMTKYALPMAYSAGGLLERLPSGAVRLGIEASYVPTPPPSVREAVRCYGSGKTEKTGLSSVLPRPRLAVGLPGNLVLEGTYLPPIKVNDATANMGFFSLAWFRQLAMKGTERAADLVLRAHASVGKVKGPITCPQEALRPSDAANACYGRNPSNDRYSPNVLGLEGAIALRGPKGSMYGGVGANSLNPKFQVDFTKTSGFHDTAHVELKSRVTRPALFAGASVKAGGKISLGGELYVVPKDGATGRFLASYRLF